MKNLILSLLLVTLTGCGFETVDTGHRGIKTTFGKIIGEPLGEGLHFYNPFTSDIIEMEVREVKIEGETPCFTKDTQNVVVAYAVVLYPDPAKIHTIYQKFGYQWSSKLVIPAIHSAIKDMIGQYVADDLVGKRDAVRVAAQKELAETLSTRDITITSISLTNLDFDDAYEKAVEEKVVATQNALAEKNRSVQVEEKAKQTIASAKADAEAMKIKTQALSQNRGLVEYEIAQKWDGKLPQNMFGGSLPMINFDSLTKR